MQGIRAFKAEFQFGAFELKDPADSADINTKDWFEHKKFLIEQPEVIHIWLSLFIKYQDKKNSQSNIFFLYFCVWNCLKNLFAQIEYKTEFF